MRFSPRGERFPHPAFGINRAVGAAGEIPSAIPPPGRFSAAAQLTQRLSDRRERVWLLVDLLVVAWLIWLFDALNNLAPVRQSLAIGDGHSVLDLERSLGLDPEHALNAWLARHHELSEIVVFWYENVHIVVTLVVFAWLWWRRPDSLGVLRATLVIVNLIALAVFWSFPVAPPRMLTGGYVDLVSSVHGLPVWQIGATALHSNQLCSLPSLHIAWATWCAIAVWKLSSRRVLRAVALAYPFVTTFAVMATANHYLADAVTGAAMTFVVYSLLCRLSALWESGWTPARSRPA
jgi:PAP2 superfamily protein